MARNEAAVRAATGGALDHYLNALIAAADRRDEGRAVANIHGWCLGMAKATSSRT